MKRRTKKLIRPPLQGKFIVAFLSVAVGSILFHSVAVALSLDRLALRLPHDGPVLMGEIGWTIALSMLLLLVLVVPLSIGVAVILTFRIAGPLYRFEQFLGSIERGERPADCNIRQGDELQEFCALLNRVTTPLRTPVDEPTPVAETEQDATAETVLRRSA